MTDPIMADLKRDEGLRLKPYRCSAGRLTIGYGRNLDDVGITHGEAEILLEHDIRRSLAALDRALPWWRTLSGDQQRGLINMCFQLGIGGLRKFEKMLAALKDSNYNKAADEALDSLYAKQTPERAKRVAKLFREG